MKSSVLKFLFSSFLAGSISAGTLGSIPAPAAQSMPGGDSITITGKFISPCFIPPIIKIWKYNVWDIYVNGDDVPVSGDGSFSYRAAVKDAHQFTLKMGKTQADILATSSEKICPVEITCDDNQQIKAEAKGSHENHAFAQLKVAGKSLSDTLEAISNMVITEKDRLRKVKEVMSDYQRKVELVEKDFPNSFTARVLCPSEILPDSTFTSMRALRDNYLNRQIFKDIRYYNTNFLASQVLTNYFFLLKKDDTTFTGFSKALNIACDNQEAGRLLEQVIYGSLYYQHKEQLLCRYINWAELNAGKMFNMPVKFMLSRLSTAIAGAPFIELTMNDPQGAPRKLSETVASGKLTLVIFYSPTCSHCRETLPKIVPLWNQYKSNGLRIYAAGFEATNEEWNDFIKFQGSPEWTNVFDYNNGRDSGAKYMATNTPTMILIDSEGKIITRFANLEYLQQEIPKYFGQ